MIPRWINADAGPGGSVRAAVLTRDGAPAAGYAAENAIPFEGDAVSTQLAWEGAQEIPAPEEGHIRLMFQLKNAKLYAFWLE